MAQTELKGKTFLHRLLKIQLQIDEKCDELAYWQKQSEFCQYDAELARSIRKRSEELEQLILEMNEQKMSATKLIDDLSDPVGRAILRRRYTDGRP